MKPLSSLHVVKKTKICFRKTFTNDDKIFRCEASASRVANYLTPTSGDLFRNFITNKMQTDLDSDNLCKLVFLKFKLTSIEHRNVQLEILIINTYYLDN